MWTRPLNSLELNKWVGICPNTTDWGIGQVKLNQQYIMVSIDTCFPREKKTINTSTIELLNGIFLNLNCRENTNCKRGFGRSKYYLFLIKCPLVATLKFGNAFKEGENIKEKSMCSYPYQCANVSQTCWLTDLRPTVWKR